MAEPTDEPSEARSEATERRLMELALARTSASLGALFVWDRKARGLVLVHHVVDGLIVTLPNRRTAGAGIASFVFERDASYLCRDTSQDEHYTRYLVDIGSIAAVPIRHQKKPIGVLTVSSREPGHFGPRDLAALESLAAAAGPLIRRGQLDRQSREETGRPFVILGLSPGWLEVERRIELSSPTQAPILIRGESGTGKDLVARAIHWSSRRAEKPFVTVNCAALPENLLESILFGHVKGAFTGASFHKVGEFHKADGGTLFLDEVGELPVMLQAKVLRAVEQGEVQPLGSNQAAERVDVRLICATNRDLEAMTRSGGFRDDLYYRLSVMTLELPPLRSYKEHLEVLCNVFLEQAAAHHGKRAPRLSAAALERLTAYDFPGNLRELKNAIEHAVILCGGADEIAAADLPRVFGGAAIAAPPSTRPARPSLRQLRDDWLAPLERRYLSELIAEHDGNVRRAAAAAGVNTVTFYRLMRRRGIELKRRASEG